MIALLRDRRRGAAIGAMLAWAALLGTTTTSLSVAFPERAARVVIHGPAYWHEMSAWLETGEGRESRPAERRLSRNGYVVSRASSHDR